MRGFPLLRGVLAVAALLLLRVPLVHITKPAAALPALAAASEKPNPKSTVQLELTATEAPFQFEVSHLGRVIWSGEATGHQARKEVAMDYPKEGVDLEIKGSWAREATFAAIKLTVTREEGEPQEKTVWAAKAFDEVLTFH